jgi:hypothetical protein
MLPPIAFPVSKEYVCVAPRIYESWSKQKMASRFTSYLACLIVALIAVGMGLPRSVANANPRQSEDNARTHHQAGVAFHLRRCLDDASREYARTLASEPARELTGEEWALVKRFAPRLYVTPTEFFPLKDFAVILHPSNRLIAYHLFWEDDIDFPEDNDPCDHELIWVEYAEDRQTLKRLWTYFHGQILDGGREAVEEARQHAMRPRINVQWGKHGSMPVSWENLKVRRDANAEGAEPISLKLYNEETFGKLSSAGRRLPNHLIAVRGKWPVKFTGDWSAFTNFSKLVEPLRLLEQRRMALVSSWNSAAINQHFLSYNFRPKTEWPPDEVDSETLDLASSDLQLPSKSVFDRTMPRYPNVWFYLDVSLASDYDEAVKLVTRSLGQAMRLPEFYGPFDNPEGCDFEVRLEHLQPWEVRDNRALQHSHSFHMRYYFSTLAKSRLEVVRLGQPGRERRFYRFAASAHYEVEHTNPNHADVEICPVCGRTAAYAERKGSLVELVHDPLGLELLLTGRVRGETVRFEDRERLEVGSIKKLNEYFAIQTRVIDGMTGDRNTLRIGIIMITRKPD